MNAAIEIDFYPLESAAIALNLSDRELREIRGLLRRKLRSDFRDRKYSRGLSSKDFRTIERFRQLAAVMGRKAAIDYLRIHGVD